MSVTREDVETIATLARLALTEDECERMATELAQILTHIDALRQVDTGAVEPMTHPGGLTLRLRPDAAAGSLSPERALDQAPEQLDGEFRVPRVIKN